MHLMKIFLVIVCLVLAWVPTEGLRCMTCINAKNDGECNRLGKMQECQVNENSCHNEVRRGDREVLITKRCKQDWACSNNHIQNPRYAWEPSQCNAKVPSSVCRCCCTTDECNKYGTKCTNIPNCPSIGSPSFGRKKCKFIDNDNEVGSVCFFSCNEGYNLVGADVSKCAMNFTTKKASFDSPVPKCVRPPPPMCRSQRPPAHAVTNCTDGFNVGSVCSYTCDEDHVLIGPETIKCQTVQRWDNIPPACVFVSCPDLITPDHGSMSCTYGFDEDSECTFYCSEGYDLVGTESAVCEHSSTIGVWTKEIPTCKRKRCRFAPVIPENGRYFCSEESFLNSECEFVCDPYHQRVGALYTKCIEDMFGHLRWDEPSPVCEEIQCNHQEPPKNGRVTCTKRSSATSVCTFECTTPGYHLTPDDVENNVCLNDSTWSRPRPCCAKSCPPYTVVDLVIIIDSSSSIGSDNWKTIKGFLRQFIETFEVADDAARFGVFRYNTRIDKRSQILFKDFPQDKLNLLKAFDAIPYSGSGTNTGRALSHAREVVFAPENGNRPDVPDYILVITDGRSTDRVALIARQLRNDGVKILAIGVVPPRGRLDINQLRRIVNDPDDLAIAQSGFQDLNISLFQRLVEALCVPGCQ